MAQYKNTSSAATAVHSARPCRLVRIQINGGTMGAITIYDNASAGSGTVIATISAPVSGQTFNWGCQAVNGITIVTAAATNLTSIIE